MSLLIIGLNHTTAPVARTFVDGRRWSRQRNRSHSDTDEAFVLSTCNREFYLLVPI